MKIIINEDGTTIENDDGTVKFNSDRKLKWVIDGEFVYFNAPCSMSLKEFNKMQSKELVFYVKLGTSPNFELRMENNNVK